MGGFFSAEVDTPKHAFLTSGGGLRSYASTAVVIKALVDAGMYTQFDHAFGLSGGAWCLIAVYSGVLRDIARLPRGADAVVERLVDSGVVKELTQQERDRITRGTNDAVSAVTSASAASAIAAASPNALPAAAASSAAVVAGATFLAVARKGLSKAARKAASLIGVAPTPAGAPAAGAAPPPVVEREARFFDVPFPLLCSTLTEQFGTGVISAISGEPLVSWSQALMRHIFTREQFDNSLLPCLVGGPGVAAPADFPPASAALVFDDAHTNDYAWLSMPIVAGGAQRWRKHTRDQVTPWTLKSLTDTRGRALTLADAAAAIGSAFAVNLRHVLSDLVKNPDSEAFLREKLQLPTHWSILADTKMPLTFADASNREHNVRVYDAGIHCNVPFALARTIDGFLFVHDAGSGRLGAELMAASNAGWFPGGWRLTEGRQPKPGDGIGDWAIFERDAAAAAADAGPRVVVYVMGLCDSATMQPPDAAQRARALRVLYERLADESGLRAIACILREKGVFAS